MKIILILTALLLANPSLAEERENNTNYNVITYPVADGIDHSFIYRNNKPTQSCYTYRWQGHITNTICSGN